MTALQWPLLAFGLVLTVLAGCGPGGSPETHAGTAARQVNLAEPGMIVGMRRIPDGTAARGTVSTTLAVGVAGRWTVAGPISAFTVLGGSWPGRSAAPAAGHPATNAAAFEYIVRKSSGALVSVTQTDKVPLALGQGVMVLSGDKARVVSDHGAAPDSGSPRAEAPVMTPTLGRPMTDARLSEAKAVQVH